MAIFRVGEIDFEFPDTMPIERQMELATKKAKEVQKFASPATSAVPPTGTPEPTPGVPLSVAGGGIWDAIKTGTKKKIGQAVRDPVGAVGGVGKGVVRGVSEIGAGVLNLADAAVGLLPADNEKAEKYTQELIRKDKEERHGAIREFTAPTTEGQDATVGPSAFATKMAVGIKGSQLVPALGAGKIAQSGTVLAKGAAANVPFALQALEGGGVKGAVVDMALNTAIDAVLMGTGKVFGQIKKAVKAAGYADELADIVARNVSDAVQAAKPGDEIYERLSQRAAAVGKSATDLIRESLSSRVGARRAVGLASDIAEHAKSVGPEQKRLMGVLKGAVETPQSVIPIEQATVKGIKKGKLGGVQTGHKVIDVSDVGKTPFGVQPGEARFLRNPKAKKTIPFGDYANTAAIRAQNIEEITPTELAATNATEAYRYIAKKLSKAGKTIDEIAESNSDKLISIKAAKDRFITLADEQLALTSGISPSPASRDAAEEIGDMLLNLPDKISPKDALALKRQLREKVKYGSTSRMGAPPTPMPILKGIQKDVSRLIDRTMDRTLDGFKEANELYSKLATAEDEFARALGPSIGLNELLSKKGPSIMKRALQSEAASGLPDLFRYVKEATDGEYDLLQDALYANIAMRLSGDADQIARSLRFGGALQIPPSLLSTAPAGKALQIGTTVAKAVGKKIRKDPLQSAVEWYNKHHGIKQTGAIDYNLMQTLSGVAGGGAVGAAVSPEGERLEGGIAGAFLGGGAVNAPALYRGLKSLGNKGTVQLTRESGEKIAKDSGTIYGGVQEGFGDIPGFHLFHDPYTKSTIAGGSVEEVMGKIEWLRQNGKEGYVDPIVLAAMSATAGAAATVAPALTEYESGRIDALERASVR